MPYAVIPLLAIIGAGFFLLCCWVYFKHSTMQADPPQTMSEEQAIYMRDVRNRNKKDIEALTGYYKKARKDWWSDNGC